MRWLDNHELYNLVPMKAKSRLPDEGFPVQPIELSPGLTFMVYCKPVPEDRKQAYRHRTLGMIKFDIWHHRVFAICKCGKHIPFGRMQQHYNKPTCK